MANGTDAHPANWTASMKAFWDSLDILKLLALFIVLTWLATIVWQYTTENETLKNIVMMIAGFLWGSSVSSRKKDDAALGQLPPVSGGTTSVTTASTVTTAPAEPPAITTITTQEPKP